MQSAQSSINVPCINAHETYSIMQHDLLWLVLHLGALVYIHTSCQHRWRTNTEVLWDESLALDRWLISEIVSDKFMCHMFMHHTYAVSLKYNHKPINVCSPSIWDSVVSNGMKDVPSRLIYAPRLRQLSLHQTYGENRLVTGGADELFWGVHIFIHV